MLDISLGLPYLACLHPQMKVYEKAVNKFPAIKRGHPLIIDGENIILVSHIFKCVVVDVFGVYARSDSSGDVVQTCTDPMYALQHDFKQIYQVMLWLPEYGMSVTSRMNGLKIPFGRFCSENIGATVDVKVSEKTTQRGAVSVFTGELSSESLPLPDNLEVAKLLFAKSNSSYTSKDIGIKK